MIARNRSRFTLWVWIGKKEVGLLMGWKCVEGIEYG
jgi:hypothetical protein